MNLPVGANKKQLIFEFDINVTLFDIEKQYIALALKQSNNIKRTAKILGLNRNTLRKRINEMGLEVKTKVGRPRTRKVSR